jgi:hypothetical protein
MFHPSVGLPPTQMSIFIFLPPLLLPLWNTGLISQFHNNFTDGRTPWTSDQLVARPLPKQRTTETQNKHMHIPNIHALCGIRTHDPGFRASEGSTCLRLAFLKLWSADHKLSLRCALVVLQKRQKKK